MDTQLKHFIVVRMTVTEVIDQQEKLQNLQKHS